MLKFDDFSFKYNDYIFNMLNVELYENKVGIVGDNGVGKTTLLRLINGDLVGETGEIIYEGPSYFMDFNDRNYMYFTIRDLIDLCKSLNSFFDDFDTLIELLHLSSYLNIALEKLSLGNKKKVYIMLGLAYNGKLLLMDEPFENLDRNSNDSLISYINKDKRSYIIVSHNLDLLRKCVDTIYEIKMEK